MYRHREPPARNADVCVASKLGGGKFANGAISGAFGRLFGEVARSGASTTRDGTPLPGKVIGALEPYFSDVDFSVIRTREGIPWFVIGEPNAFTFGNNIYFGAGKYDPLTASGISLIGHEVDHVQDFQRFGIAPMTTDYISQYVGGRVSGLNHNQAYINISYERKAFSLQFRIRRDLACIIHER